MTTVGDDAFLADDTLVGSYELGRRLDAHRAGQGRQARVPRQLGHDRPGPRRAQEQPRRRAVGRARAGQGRHVLARQPPGASCGAAPPAATRAAPSTRRPGQGAARRSWSSVGSSPPSSRARSGSAWRWPSCSSPRPLGALLAPLLRRLAVLIVAAAWSRRWWPRSPSGLLVGRHRRIEHPLWSRFVWRNELADVVRRDVAVPWFVRGSASATPAVRAVAARRWAPGSGAGVWCETYWLPEADLVHLGDGATVNRGCVLQTHLFHDRIMSMDTVDPRRRRDPRPAQRHPAGGLDRRARRPSARSRSSCAATPCPPARAGPATRSRPGHEPRAAGAPARPRDGATPYLPGHGDCVLRRRVATTSSWTTAWRTNRLDARRRASSVVARDASSTGSPSTCTASTCRRCWSTDAGGRLRRPLAAGKLRAARPPGRRPATHLASPIRYGGHAGSAAQHLGRRRLGGADRRRHRRRPAERAPRPGSRATTGRAARRVYRIAVTTESAYTVVANGLLARAQCRARAGRPGASSRPQPMATYLATVQIGRYEQRALTEHALCHSMLVAPRRCAGRVPRRLRPPGRDDGGLRASSSGPTRSTATPSSSPRTTWRSRSRRRACRSSAPTTSTASGGCERLVAHELAHQWFGNSLTLAAWRTSGCTRASPATPSGSGPSARAVGRPTSTPGHHHAALAGEPQDLVVADPGPEPMFDDRLYKRGALTLHALRLTSATPSSSSCCATGPPSTATARSARPTSRPTPIGTAPGPRSCAPGCTSAGCPLSPRRCVTTALQPRTESSGTASPVLPQ